MKLFKFQEDGVNEILTKLKTHKSVCLAWYTGAGKTNVFVEVCRRLIAGNPKVKIGISAYLTTEIKEQVAERFISLGLGDKMWVFEASKSCDLSKNIFIFNPQTIFRNPPDLIFDYYIVDESHAAIDDNCSMLPKIMKKTCDENTKMLLVSATPWDTLALKRFKDSPVLKRPLDAGLADGLITDFRFHAEEALITFSEKDFTRAGDLGASAAQREMAVLKSACLGKLEYLLENYDKQIGKKCLVICPPGNIGEVARTLAEKYSNGLAFTQFQRLTAGNVSHWKNTEGHLQRFKSDPAVRFLFVINKCGVGFDMQELDSVVDLTMSRNVKVLAQRCGRVARKSGKKEKHYFYVYDQSLMKNQLEWLVVTMIDFCLGAYDGWTTKTAKYKKPGVNSQWSYKHPFAVTLTEIVAALRDDNLIHNQRTLAYIAAHGPPTKWTLPLAIETAKKWPTRTDMWREQPALYKWFRLNAKAEMDRIFPFKNKLGKWNERTVTDALKDAKAQALGRKAFKVKYPGASWWLERHNRRDLLEHYIEFKNGTPWTKARAKYALGKVKTWGEVRYMGGLRGWIMRNGGEHHWQKIWMNMVRGSKVGLRGKRDEKASA